MYKIVYTTQAQKDARKLSQSALLKKTRSMIDILRVDPYRNPPPYEKLTGDLNGLYSRRMNIQHRLVYQVYKDEKIVKIIRMWTHYE